MKLVLGFALLGFALLLNSPISVSGGSVECPKDPMSQAGKQEYCIKDNGCEKHGAGSFCEIDHLAKECPVCGPAPMKTPCTGFCYTAAGMPAIPPKCDKDINIKQRVYCLHDSGCIRHGAGVKCVVDARAKSCSVCGPEAKAPCSGFCERKQIRPRR